MPEIRYIYCLVNLSPVYFFPGCVSSFLPMNFLYKRDLSICSDYSFYFFFQRNWSHHPEWWLLASDVRFVGKQSWILEDLQRRRLRSQWEWIADWTRNQDKRNPYHRTGPRFPWRRLWRNPRLPWRAHWSEHVEQGPKCNWNIETVQVMSRGGG